MTDDFFRSGFWPGHDGFRRWSQPCGDTRHCMGMSCGSVGREGAIWQWKATPQVMAWLVLASRRS